MINVFEQNKDYTWVKFYEEFADKLIEYKDNREELLNKIEKIFERLKLKLPKIKLEEGKEVDIDPFTVFSLFNRQGLIDYKKPTLESKEERIRILKEIGEEFNLESECPKKIENVSFVNDQAIRFYKEKEHIISLWELFLSALDYSKNKKNKEEFIQKYNVVKEQVEVKENLTRGLFWIRPSFYLNLDSKNRWYINPKGYNDNFVKDYEKLPQETKEKLKEIVENFEKLPEIKEKISKLKSQSEKIPNGEEYLDIMEKMKENIETGNYSFKSFVEFSNLTFRESDRVNKIIKNKNQVVKVENLEIKDKILDKNSYTETDFLGEIYIEEENYNKLVKLLERKKNLILQGPPGVGKTFVAKRLAYSIMKEKNDNRIKIVQFHQSYSYEDFIMGFRPSIENNNSQFELKEGVFYKFCKKAENDPENKYYFIIDEINRGNMSKIFGELFVLIEGDKRGEKLKLLYSEEEFSIPKNLYIIGMMNTADRSLAMLDYALRRRFAFYEFIPAFENEKFIKYYEKEENKKLNRIIENIILLNKEIEEDETLGRGFKIGHSYFCSKEEEIEEWLESIIEYEVLPLLEEYWFDDLERIKNWKNKFNSILKSKN